MHQSKSRTTLSQNSVPTHKPAEAAHGLVERECFGARPDPSQIHRDWALKAWEALECSFIRFPDKGQSNDRLKKAKASFLALYEKRSLQGTAIKWLKFHCSYAFAVGLCQTELASAPYEEEGRESDGCFCFELQHTMHQAMRRASTGNWSYRRFLIDILYAKNGMPPAMEGFVKASLLDHKKAMTQTRSTDWLDRLLLKEPLRLVEAEIRKEVSRLFAGKVFEHTDPFPSVSSSYESSLQDGGSFAELMKDFVAPVSIFKTDGSVDDEVLVECFQDYIDKVWISRLDDPLDVTPVAILEPLKVRIITKGQAAEYYRCVELQKFMHTVLRHHPVFEFIGRPIEDRSFARCFGFVEGLLDDEFFVSGDYKAATDNLNPELSMLCWEQICLNTHMKWQGADVIMKDTPYYFLGRKALTRHRVHYKDSTVEQTWGQLMGSPMSFPILCLVNSAATHVAIGARFSKASKMRVNGDDIAFVANPRSYAIWKSITAACGLEFSIGKNYCSREFLVMNSEIRRAPHWKLGDYLVIPGEVVGDPLSEEDPERQMISIEPGHVWRLEGFYNQSIARSIVRKGVDAGKPKDVYWTDLGHLAEALLRGIDKRHQEPILRDFLIRNRSVVMERPTGCNLFFPKSLGGAGLPVPLGQTTESVQDCHQRSAVLESARKRAAYLATHGVRRLQLPHVRLEDHGHVAKAIKKAKESGPSRVPRPIIDGKKDLGLNSTQLLSRVIQEYYILGKTDPGGRALRESRVAENAWKGNPITTPAVHRKRNKRLIDRYNSFVKGCYTLDPMSFEKISQFEETEFLDTLWPVTGCPVPKRACDWLELSDSTLNQLGVLCC